MPPLPQPLPPEERPVGQLVAEAIRLYGRRFWRALALGVPPAAVNALARTLDDELLLLGVPLLGGALVSLSYLGAVALAAGSRVPVVAPVAAGTLVFLPVPFLATFFILPALVWLGAFGLVVPVLALERRRFWSAFRRAFALARADFVHALGSLAALAIVVFLTQAVLFFLLRGFGEQAVVGASFLASLVVSPLLFLGAALLYFDQAAREHQKHVPRAK